MLASDANSEQVEVTAMNLEARSVENEECDEEEEVEMEVSEKEEEAVWAELRLIEEELRRLRVAITRKFTKAVMESETDIWYDKANEFVDKFHEQDDDVCWIEQRIEYDFTLTQFVGVWKIRETIGCDEYETHHWTENYQRPMNKDIRIRREGHRITIGTVVNGVPDQIPQEAGFDEVVNGSQWFVKDGHLITEIYKRGTKEINERVDRWVEDDMLTVVNTSRGKTCTRVYKKAI